MEEIPVIDPHFHIWDVTEYERTGHALSHLSGPAVSYPRYLRDDYYADMESVSNIGSANLRFKEGVFVEALSDYPVREAQWVAANMNPCPAIVGYAYLSDSNVENTLKGLSECPRVVGIRQIVNHHPSDSSLIWPKVHRSDYLTNAAFRRGYSLLGKYNFSFDLHANPHQLKDAAALFHDHPHTPVIIDHLGCLQLSHDKRENELRLKVWREGMHALSLLPYSSVKISCLTFTKKGWEQSPTSHNGNEDAKTTCCGGVEDSCAYEQLKSLVLETITLFGSDRCMFATNFPVDKHNGVSAQEMYQTFSEWVSELPLSAKRNLFHDTASRVYRLS